MPGFGAVPGLLDDKVTALIRGLPKALRRNFVPAPDFARAFEEKYGIPILEGYGCTMISDPGVIPVKFRAPGGTVAELVPKGRYKQLED